MIKIDASRMGRDIKALTTATKAARAEMLGEQTMLGVAGVAVAIIDKRTGEGRDADGADFAPYTPAYKDWRSKKGYSTRPNLTVRHHMLGAMAAKFVSAGKALIYFTRGIEGQKAAGNNKKREFFDVRQDNEVSALRNDLERRVNAIAARLGL